MSGALKSVGKTFKKVVSNPLKLIPAALGVAALVFTAGSALGALPSWGEAAGSVFGTDSVLGRVLTGAATQAGYGAVLGGLTSAVTGGDVSNGIEIGGGVGGVTGGVAGGLGFETDLLKGLVRDPAAGAGIGAGTAATGAPAASPQFIGPLNSSAMVASGAAPALTQAAAAAPALGAAPQGLLSNLNSSGSGEDVFGKLIAGAGAGWANGLQAEDQSKALLQRDAAARAAIAANYGTGTKGLLTKGDTASLPSGNANPTPTDRFDPSTYGGQWVYDPTLAKIVYVKNQAVA